MILIEELWKCLQDFSRSSFQFFSLKLPIKIKIQRSKRFKFREVFEALLNTQSFKQDYKLMIIFNSRVFLSWNLIYINFRLTRLELITLSKSSLIPISCHLKRWRTNVFNPSCSISSCSNDFSRLVFVAVCCHWKALPKNPKLNPQWYCSTNVISAFSFQDIRVSDLFIRLCPQLRNVFYRQYIYLKSY